VRALLFLTLTSTLGCGSVYYTFEVNSAASKVEEARILGAESLAPYEYYYAKAHLEQAAVEGSEGHYSDGAHMAETSQDYAQQAIEIATSASGKKNEEGK